MSELYAHVLKAAEVMVEAAEEQWDRSKTAVAATALVEAAILVHRKVTRRDSEPTWNVGVEVRFAPPNQRWGTEDGQKKSIVDELVEMALKIETDVDEYAYVALEKTRIF